MCLYFTVFPSLCDIRYKAASGELEQITSDAILRVAIGNLEDGFRLTLWAYEKKEVYKMEGRGREVHVRRKGQLDGCCEGEESVHCKYEFFALVT